MHPSLPSQSLTRLQPSQLQKYLRGAEFYLEKGPIQPEVWPTKEQFQMAKIEFSTIQKSSTGTSLFVETLELARLISAFCGLKRNGPQAARTGVDEPNMVIS